MITVKKITILFSIAIIFLFAACQKEVEVKLPESSYKLVLNSILSSDSVVKVLVSRSKKLYVDDVANLKINNAVVSLYEDNDFIEILPRFEDGVYKSLNFKPQIGKEYKVIVRAPGYTDAVAKETIIQQAEINNITFQDSALILEQQMMAKVSFDIVDVPGTKNYYELSIQSFFYNYNFNPNTGQIIDSTKLPIPAYLTITDEALKENYEGSGLDGGNYYYTDALAFTDKFFDGKNFKVNVYFSSYQANVDTLTIRIKSMTKSYYEYKRSVNLQSSVGSNPFSEPVRVFTNVEGGLGILGSYTEIRKKVSK
jgi:hypothetical protein